MISLISLAARFFFLVIRKKKQPTACPGGVQLDSRADAWRENDIRWLGFQRTDGYDG